MKIAASPGRPQDVGSRDVVSPVRDRRGTPQRELPNRFRSPTPMTSPADTDRFHRKPAKHMFDCNG